MRMMRVFVVGFVGGLCGAIVAVAGDTWPAGVVYDGGVRDAAWLDMAYQRIASRIVLADGKYWHLDEPQRKAMLGAAYRDHRLARVAKLLDGELLLCDLEGGGTCLAAKRIPFEATAGQEVMLTPNPAAAKAPATAEWLAFPCESRPITRPQFVEAIRAGLQLFYVLPCRNCGGDGVRVGPETRYDGMKIYKVTVKRRCDPCGGKGEMPVPSIRR